jgi:hypothetical protein
MLHWYLLVTDSLRPTPDVVERFSASGGPRDSLQSLSSGDRRRFFWLGAVEALPLGLAVCFGAYLEPAVASYGLVSAGVSLSLLLCWLLRKRVPPSIIHVAATAADSDGEQP